MRNVDALSRNPLPSCLVLSECNEGLLVRLKKAQREDNDLKQVFEAIERGETKNYVIKGGILYREVDDDVRIVVPKAIQTQIIGKAHEQGHFGINKTEALVKADYWVHNLCAKVEKFITNCISCILAERKHEKQECFLHPIEKSAVRHLSHRLFGSSAID